MGGFLALTGTGLGDAFVAGGFGVPLGDELEIPDLRNVTARLLSEREHGVRLLSEREHGAKLLP